MLLLPTNSFRERTDGSAAVRLTGLPEDELVGVYLGSFHLRLFSHASHPTQALLMLDQLIADITLPTRKITQVCRVGFAHFSHWRLSSLGNASRRSTLRLMVFPLPA